MKFHLPLPASFPQRPTPPGLVEGTLRMAASTKPMAACCSCEALAAPTGHFMMGRLMWVKQCHKGYPLVICYTLLLKIPHLVR
jgi:hypothetical protein